MSRNELLEAQMHMECLNEAWNELNFWKTLDLQEPDKARKDLLMEEIGTRIWAAIYLVQHVASGVKPENYDETLKQANRFNGVDDAEALDHGEVH